jgi:hypothetical protein
MHAVRSRNRVCLTRVARLRQRRRRDRRDFSDVDGADPRIPDRREEPPLLRDRRAEGEEPLKKQVRQ